MSAKGRYDGALQMFCDDERQFAVTGLKFLRWLAERGQLEHGVAGPPAGPLAMPGPLDELRHSGPSLADAL